MLRGNQSRERGPNEEANDRDDRRRGRPGVRDRRARWQSQATVETRKAVRPAPTRTGRGGRAVETGAPKANAVERDSEDGAVWEVEVTKADGSTVDVRLDADMHMVKVESDSEG